MVNGVPAIIDIDRVPCVGEYISGANGLFRVMAVVFIPNNVQVHAVVFAEKDADGKPDELGLMPDAV